LLFAELALAELEPPTFAALSSFVVCAGSNEEEKARQTAQVSGSKVHVLFVLPNIDKA